jgi:hypothetical protein
MTPIPDHPGGLRFCRQCASFLPISQFHAGVRRFECKTHALERAGRYRKNAAPLDANRRAVQRVWHALWADSRIVFGRKNAGLTQADVRHLFEQKGMALDIGWRVFPKDPHAEWGLKNAEIVPKGVRNALVSTFLKQNRGGEGVQMDREVLAKCAVVEVFLLKTCVVIIAREKKITCTRRASSLTF